MREISNIISLISSVDRTTDLYSVCRGFESLMRLDRCLKWQLGQHLPSDQCHGLGWTSDEVHSSFKQVGRRGVREISHQVTSSLASLVLVISICDFHSQGESLNLLRRSIMSSFLSQHGIKTEDDLLEHLTDEQVERYLREKDELLLS